MGLSDATMYVLFICTDTSGSLRVVDNLQNMLFPIETSGSLQGY